MTDENKKEDIKAGNQLRKEQQIQQFVNSEDWKLIKRKLFEKLLELDSLSVLIEGMKYPTIKKIGEKSYVNGKVCSIIIQWMTEIEGTTIPNNRNFMDEMRKEDFLVRDY